MKSWGRTFTNTASKIYEVEFAAGNLGEPRWPNLTYDQIIEIAFRGRIIETLDHPLLRRLRGEIA
jgi:hypothetical protein